MATATKKRRTSKKNTPIKTALTEVNTSLITVAEELIETGVATGEKYQTLFAKSLKKTEPLMTKQVDIAIETVESLIDQYQFGAQRFRKLIGWKDIKKAADKNLKTLKDTVNDNIENLKETASDRLVSVQTEINERAKNMPTPIKNVLTTEVKTTVKTAAKRAAAKTIATTKKAAPKAKTVAKATSKKVTTDLKVIDGIGPKMETILKSAGVKSIQGLAKTTPSKIETIIEKSKSNFRAVNAKGWIAQAKKMA